MGIKTIDYYYDLPKENIAQTPLEPRDSSKLFVIKSDGSYEHKHFYDILDYLKSGDVLVRNNTRVLPARLYGIKAETGAKIEILLLKRIDLNNWEIILKPAKRTQIGTEIVFGDGLLKGIIKDAYDNGNRVIEFTFEGVFEQVLDQIGQMPLPPYIFEKLEDKERYQTVYSKETGSSAAPTAGLHFTNELLQKIKDKGVIITDVLLHVGLGTFRPVSEEDITEHVMHSEYYQLGEQTAKIINEAKAQGRRVISVGTTSTRVLETVAINNNGAIVPEFGNTEIFIYPGYDYHVVDAIITNFHLPESTLVMMIAAFCGRECILDAYKIAVNKNYRFFSFGDAMFIEKPLNKNINN